MISPNESGNEDNVFPMLPGFLRDITSIRKNNAQIQNFERIFFRNSLYSDVIMQSEQTKLKGDVICPTTADTPDGLKEDVISLASNGNKNEPPDFQVPPKSPNSVALSDVDDVIQRFARCAEVEIMCKDIAKEIVERSAELYAACLFDAMKCLYTSFSVWDELRGMVAHSFLTRDCRTGAACPSSPLPAASFTLRAADQLHLAAKRERRGNEDAEWLNAGSPPQLIPMDEYCRYVVERLFPSSRPSLSERNTSKRTISYIATQTGPSSVQTHSLASGEGIGGNKVLGLSSESPGRHTSQESILSLNHDVTDSPSVNVKENSMRTRRSGSSSFRLRSDKSNSQGPITAAKWSGDGTIRIAPSVHDRPTPPITHSGKGTAGAFIRRVHAKKLPKLDSTHPNRIKDKQKGVN
ncbi:unnamed protein product [Phytomonas sp. Hart1]|nr:unnamed protein product [Phytomonas sp. Hart1]|eukprot:CCW70518.1 unnamed protein product [Phytomonas sp. isolate Hart1]